MVQQVERFESELQAEALGNGGGLHGAEIHADEAWAAQNAPMGRSKDLGIRGQGKSGKIPPVQEGLGAAVGIANQITVVLLKPNIVDRSIAGREARGGETGTYEADAADLPAPQYLFHWARPIGSPVPAFAEGQFVQRAVYPVDLGIERRRTVIELEIINVRRGHAIAPVPRS